MPDSKVTTILLLLQNYPRLCRFLIDAEQQSFHVERAKDILAAGERPFRERELLVRLSLEIWLEIDGLGMDSLLELVGTRDLAPAISGLKYYLHS